MKDKEFQQKLVDKLKNGELSYEDATIYTIILDLVQGNGKEEVLRVFNEVIMEKPKTTGDIGVDYALAQSKAIQKSMHLDSEMAYRSLPKQDETEHLLSTETNKNRLLEDVKQETLEEAAEWLYPENWESIMDGQHDSNSYERNAFINGAKWQQEQDKKMYSEEEVIWMVLNNPYKFEDNIREWFEQFKKK